MPPPPPGTPRDYTEGELQALNSTLGSPPPAQPENPSDDRKEVVLSVRSAGEPPIKDTACQTNGPRTTGMRTVQTISTDLRTGAPRGGAVTRSPDTGLTPKVWLAHTGGPSLSLPQEQAGDLGHLEGAGLV